MRYLHEKSLSYQGVLGFWGFGVLGVKMEKCIDKLSRLDIIKLKECFLNDSICVEQFNNAYKFHKIH